MLELVNIELIYHQFIVFVSLKKLIGGSNFVDEQVELRVYQPTFELHLHLSNCIDKNNCFMINQFC